MLDAERKRYLDEAKAMIDCIEGIDCGISGRGSVEEELVALSPVEVERANVKYRSLMADEGEDGSHGGRLQLAQDPFQDGPGDIPL